MTLGTRGEDGDGDGMVEKERKHMGFGDSLIVKLGWDGKMGGKRQRNKG